MNEDDEVVCVGEDRLIEVIQTNMNQPSILVEDSPKKTISQNYPIFNNKRKNEAVDNGPNKKIAKNNKVQNAIESKLLARSAPIKPTPIRLAVPHKPTPRISHVIDDDEDVLETAIEVNKGARITKLVYEQNVVHDFDARCLHNDQIIKSRTFYIGSNTFSIELVDPDEKLQTIYSSFSQVRSIIYIKLKHFQDTHELEYITVKVDSIQSAWIIDKVIGMNARISINNTTFPNQTDSESKGFFIIFPSANLIPLLSHILPHASTFTTTSQLYEHTKLSPSIISRSLSARLIDGRAYLKEPINTEKPIITYKNIGITRSDIRRLEENQMLNDQVIDFYVEHLQENNIEKIHIFHTTFFPLLQKDFSRLAQRVPSPSTRIFKKDLIMVPINLDNIHWILVSIIKPSSQEPIIVYCDSLAKRIQPHIVDRIIEYMNMRWAIEDSQESPKQYSIQQAILPQQEQGSVDCGVYICKYMELFIKQYNTLTYPINKPSWFTKNDVKQTRIKI
ncbi:ubiquitin-like protease, partial [Acrasis kona]